MEEGSVPPGYVRMLRQLMMSEYDECIKRLKAAGITYVITDNGDPNEMGRANFDLEIDIWIRPEDTQSARTLLRDVPTWTGKGCLEDEMDRV